MAQKPARMKPRLSAEALWDFAVKVLAARAYSTGELRRKLIQKAERAADVDEAISRLRDYGYLNDRRFAESYAGFRLENQGLGKSRVLRDLRQRNVGGDALLHQLGAPRSGWLATRITSHSLMASRSDAPSTRQPSTVAHTPHTAES